MKQLDRDMRGVSAFPGAAAFLMLAVLFGCGPDMSESNHQAIAVIDGDTLQIQGRTIQLFGIDAPELGQTCHAGGVDRHCGLDAAYELRKAVGVLMADHEIACETMRKIGARLVAICKIGGEDIAIRMLRDGLVLVTSDAPTPYLDAKETAQKGHLGLWHETFVDPALWRKSAVERRGSQGADEQCVVMGLVNTSGEKRYYTPLDDDYDAQGRDRADDLRWFCSDDEAESLGWTHVGSS